MKTSLDHLPEKMRIELRSMAAELRDISQIQMVILFGSFARGDWVDDRYVENGTTYEYRSDYDLLIVVRNEKEARHCEESDRIERLIKDRVRVNRDVSFIYHGIKYFNKELEECNYFFNDIYSEGIILYDNGKHTLSQPKPMSSELRYEKAKDYFEKWFERSEEFFDQFKYAFSKNRLAIATFLLHQATERYFNTILLVFTDYKTKTHNLEKLFRLSYKENIEVRKVFPLKTKEEKRLFRILKDAYIDSRYKIDYSIEKEELEYLEEKVKILQNLTEKICKEKIEEFKNEAD